MNFVEYDHQASFFSGELYMQNYFSYILPQLLAIWPTKFCLNYLTVLIKILIFSSKYLRRFSYLKVPQISAFFFCEKLKNVYISLAINRFEKKSASYLTFNE